MSAVAALTDARLKVEGLNIEPGTDDHLRASHLMLRAYVEAAYQIAARAEGSFAPPFRDGLFVERVTPPLAASTTTASETPSGPTLGKTIEKYLAERLPSWSLKTRRKEAAILRLFAEVVGSDSRMMTIGLTDVVRLKDILRRLPANHSKLWPGVPVAEVVERPNLPAAMSTTTLNTYLSKTGGFLRWCASHGLTGARLDVAGLKLKASGKAKERRDPFSVDQLRAIFAGPLYTGCLGPRYRFWPGTERIRDDARFWAPLIGLYSGARLGEICGLRVADVAEIDGVPVLNIRETDERDLKTTGSRRMVPIHARLLDVGLLEYAATLKAKREARLFPELRVRSDGYISDEISRWFSRGLKRLEAKTPKTSFHSFRHNFSDALKMAGVPGDRRRAIMGWTSRDMDESTYGGSTPGAGFSLATLKADVDRVAYPLDWGHLTR
ncbi:MAG: site-specific integrase [Proteobacteria bacterium]|nr:site-specific integrase [Pseudomonadota bacterium]MBI3498507.1 site-specific integrase [Pseudomonadota bacterium]